MDAWAAPGALLWAFLAMGHLAEGSDPGLPSRLGLRTSLAGYREQPVALYAAVLALGLTVVLYRLVRRQQAAGQLAGAGLLLAGAVQFALTFLRIRIGTTKVQGCWLGSIRCSGWRWDGGSRVLSVAAAGEIAGDPSGALDACVPKGDVGMPSKNMLPKGQRHRSVRAGVCEDARGRGAGGARDSAAGAGPVCAGSGRGDTQRGGTGGGARAAAGQYLAQAIPEISRSRVQLLVESGQVLINGVAPKAKHKVTPGVVIVIQGSPRPAPLKATAEDHSAGRGV